MRLKPDALAGRLAGELPPLVLLFGPETLLVEESADAVRTAALQHGFEERLRHTVDQSFDWDALAQQTATMSLFSTRRLVELRIPESRLRKATTDRLAELAPDPPADTLFCVITGRIDRRAQSSAWFKAVDGAGITAEHGAIGERALPRWIGARFAAQGVRPEPGAVERLAHYVEGNLLAAAQEIRHLALAATDGRVTAGQVESSLADQARFTVYVLVDAAVAGDTARAQRVLASLAREGAEPAIVVWALAREVRMLAGLAAGLARGSSQAELFKRANVWASRQGLVRAALERHGAAGWAALLVRVARLDRMLKGRQSVTMGGSLWDELGRVVLAIGGCAPFERGARSG